MSKEWWDAERQAWFDISKEPPPSTVEGRPKVVLVRGDRFDVVDYVCEVRADGSSRFEADGPEDHSRAMEAFDRGQALRASTPAPAVSFAPVPQHRRTRAIGAADQWLKSIASDTSQKTLTIKSAAVMEFAQHVGSKKMVHEVAREDVHAWVEALRASGLQTPTLVNKTSYLRGFFEWAVQGS